MAYLNLSGNFFLHKFLIYVKITEKNVVWVFLDSSQLYFSYLWCVFP